MLHESLSAAEFPVPDQDKFQTTVTMLRRELRAERNPNEDAYSVDAWGTVSDLPEPMVKAWAESEHTWKTLKASRDAYVRGEF